jgi:HNH endonuclease
MAKRPSLPRPLEREVTVEAGHRCAIPACRLHPIEVAHIEPPKPDGSNDVFDNLIALCRNCHGRYDRGEIDRPSMRQYKANLSVLNNRYGDLERRLLLAYAREPGTGVVQLPGGLGLLLTYLIEDELIRDVSPETLGIGQVEVMGMPSHEYFMITDKGREFIARWLRAEDLEQT